MLLPCVLCLCEGGKLKPLKQPKKGSKEYDEVGLCCLACLRLLCVSGLAFVESLSHDPAVAKTASPFLACACPLLRMTLLTCKRRRRRRRYAASTCLQPSFVLLSFEFGVGC